MSTANYSVRQGRLHYCAALLDEGEQYNDKHDGMEEDEADLAVGSLNAPFIFSQDDGEGYDDDPDGMEEDDLVDEDIVDGASDGSDDAARMGIQSMQVTRHVRSQHI